MELLTPGGDLPGTAPDYRELLARPDLSVGVYTLPAGSTDLQSPHTEDEIYVCTAGRATLWTPDGSAEMTPGAVTFVPAGEEHRFVDIAEDFTVIVAFGPAEGSREPADQEAILTAAHGETEIATTRRDGSPAFVPIWMVKVQDGLYARAWRGPETGWYRHALDRGETVIRIHGVEHRMLATAVPGMLREAIDAAYRETFTGQDAEYVPPMVADAAASRTIRLRLAAETDRPATS